MGIGLVVVASSECEEKLQARLAAEGHEAYIIGTVTANQQSQSVVWVD